MHTFMTADVAREVVADRLRSAEDVRRARKARAARMTRLLRG